MDRKEIEELRERVSCGAVLETDGFAIDVKESTRRAMKFRRGSEIIIVTHDGRGWFNPLGDEKGDVFSLVSHLGNLRFTDAIARVSDLTGFTSAEPVWQPSRANRPIEDRWMSRKALQRGSNTWHYLRQVRAIPAAIIRRAISQDVLREGPRGSMWAAHTDGSGTVSGWEERGPDWRGFATGGTKLLFRLGAAHATRLCVTEAAIDAMSLAAIEGLRAGTVYLSTGGGWSPATETALRSLLLGADSLLVGATDANSQGDVFAHRLRSLADEVGCGWLRLRPQAEDWNAFLQEHRTENATPHDARRRPGSPLAVSKRATSG